MTKALVLGGGGAVGIAWESGLIAGLAENGVDVSSADFIVGTSAGSFVGAQLAQGKSPAEIAAPGSGRRGARRRHRRPSAGSDHAHHENGGSDVGQAATRKKCAPRSEPGR